MTRVVVVGGGNAALCAALAASEVGASVTLLEAAPPELRGGNSLFTAGTMRVSYESLDDLCELVPDLDRDSCADVEMYGRSRFIEDMGRVTDYRCDPDLAETLVGESHPTLAWLRSTGVRFIPKFGTGGTKFDGKPSGIAMVQVSGGGPGLVDRLYELVERAGVAVRYRTRAVELTREAGRVVGVSITGEGADAPLPADGVVLACGGFESSAEQRARYLGSPWDMAKVRGTRFNNGDGLRMGIAAGASTAGQWSGAHAVGWDRNAPEFGDPKVGSLFEKHSYPFSIMVNARGERFVDEGADFRNYTYATYGKQILAQPDHMAWQVFDDQVTHLLRDEYYIKQMTRVTASSIEGLADKLDGVDRNRFLSTVAAYNDAVQTDTPFEPSVRDGRATTGLTPDKTNWANTISVPPFSAFQVTCGITFTFGGLRVNPAAEVLDTDLRPIGGLYAAGEMVGGLFYSNYPAGTGLTSGATFGRLAGLHAGARA